MDPDRNRIRENALSGLWKGWRSYLWVLKILLPVSFFTALLERSGWISEIDFLFQPLMGSLNLPSIAAFPLLVGMVTGIYGGIGAMASLPFTYDQITLMARRKANPPAISFLPLPLSAEPAA